MLDALDLPRHAMHDLRLVGERERGLALVDRLVEVLLHLLLERVARLRAARDLDDVLDLCEVGQPHVRERDGDQGLISAGPAPTGR